MKPDVLYVNIKINNKNQSMLINDPEKALLKKKKRRKTRQRNSIYLQQQNRIYLGKRPQKGTEAISRVIARLLENVGDVIGL